ncbi:MAG: NAD-dependent epimerase/dehydratase family protein [Bacteroidota bacterium]
MIAVTGANGLLGSFIVRKLLEQQAPFVALKRAGSDCSLLSDVADKVTWREASMADPLALGEALQDVTHVIHTAAVVSFNPRHRRKIYDVNVLGTRHVVNACLENQVKRLLHVSSVAALGRTRGQQRVDEKSKWAESSLNTVYAETKHLAELEVFRGQEEGLSTIIINPSVILAPADWTKSSAQLFKYVWDEKPFYTDASLNYVDVRDVSELVYRLLMAQLEEDRFIASAGNISFYEFFSKVARYFNKKNPHIKLDKNFLRVAAWVESIRARITGIEPLITSETARMAGMHFQYDNSKIKKTLNFEFQPIENSIQWCTDYYIRKVNGKK